MVFTHSLKFRVILNGAVVCDWQVLEAISRHEMFSKSVQEMIYDLSFYDPCFSQSIDQYLFALKRSYFQTRRDNSLFEYSRALRGYKIYEERVYWQHQILSQHVEHNATESLRGLAVLDLNIGSSGELLGETDDHLGKLAYNWSLVWDVF